MFLQLTLAAFLSAPGEQSWRMPRRNINKMAFAVPIHIQVEHASIPSIPVSSLMHSSIFDWLQQQSSLVSLVPPACAAEPPSNSDVDLLNRAMVAYSKNDDTATDLLTQTIAAWKDQPSDELAALYLLRANSYMVTSSTTATTTTASQQEQNAIEDYTRAIPNLQSNDLPSAYLGRARAFRSLSLSNPSNAASAAANNACNDYRMSFELSSRDRDDFEDYNYDNDGTSTTDDSSSLFSLYARINPYAAWEWGSSLLTCGQYRDAARLHTAASRAFDAVGDHGRAVISLLDAGIDMAALVASLPSSSSNDDTTITIQNDAKKLLINAIDQTTTVQGRDVALLQRVIATEGEARVALATILWSLPSTTSSSSTGSSKQEAEAQLGQACLRLEQLDQDAMERNAKAAGAVSPSKGAPMATTNPKYSIDDQAGALDVSCSRFKNDKFLADTLQWPAPLRDSVRKLITLQ